MKQVSKLTIKACKNNQYSSFKDEFTSFINPENLFFKSNIVYHAPPSRVKRLKYRKSPPTLLSFSLLFDSTGMIPGTGNKNNVMDQVKRLQDITYNVQKEQRMPNYLRIIWGDIDFKGRLIDLNINYSLFKSDGTLVRAEARLAILGEQSIRKVVNQTADQSASPQARSRMQPGPNNMEAMPLQAADGPVLVGGVGVPSAPGLLPGYPDLPELPSLPELANSVDLTNPLDRIDTFTFNIPGMGSLTFTINNEKILGLLGHFNTLRSGQASIMNLIAMATMFLPIQISKFALIMQLCIAVIGLIRDRLRRVRVRPMLVNGMVFIGGTRRRRKRGPRRVPIKRVPLRRIPIKRVY